MADPRIEKQYAKLLEQRAKAAARNVSEGRSLNMPGVPLNDPKAPAGTLSEVLDTLRTQGKATNLEDTIKKTPTDMIGIDPSVRNKSKFLNLDKKLAGIADTAGDVGKVVNEEAGLLKNKAGFAKMIPMLGLGAAGLAGLSIAGKVQAGELGEAGLETADLATDYVPGVGQLKMALRPTELGSSELPEELMKEREIYNAARRGNVNQSNEQPLLEPEDRATYDDMKKKINFNVLNRIK